MQNAAKALIRNEAGEILVLYRSETHPHLAHDIDLPGGEIDAGEQVVDGLMREIAEETGIAIRLTEDDAVHSWRSRFFREIHSLYTARIRGATTVQISWEHEKHAWITTEEFIATEAQDEFMHKVQEWLAAKDDDVSARESHRTSIVA